VCAGAALQGWRLLTPAGGASLGSERPEGADPGDSERHRQPRVFCAESARGVHYSGHVLRCVLKQGWHPGGPNDILPSGDSEGVPACCLFQGLA